MKPWTVSALGLALFTGCGSDQSILGSDSPGAATIESLWWIALASTGVLSVAVFVGLFVAVRRAARTEVAHTGEPAATREVRAILLLGGLTPATFLIAFLFLVVQTGETTAEPPEEPTLTLDVIGHRFWWEVRYPEGEIVTANEIHIPAERTVRVRVTSQDVIHSFWVPQISPGKVDMTPGRTNTIWMFAPEPGTYRGQCTEFCGVQHARMSLLVIASPEAEFEAWRDDRRESRPIPSGPGEALGMAVFFGAGGCAGCHAVDGIRPPDPGGMAGPNLTDVVTRRTLGALTLENNRENLAAWIRDPHQFKRGVRMPPNPLDEEEIEGILAFLEALR